MPSVLQDVAKSDDAEHIRSLSKDIDQRLKVAEHCAKVTSLLYVNLTENKSIQHSPRSLIARSLALELQTLEKDPSADLQGKHLYKLALTFAYEKIYERIE